MSKQKQRERLRAGGTGTGEHRGSAADGLSVSRGREVKSRFGLRPAAHGGPQANRFPIIICDRTASGTLEFRCPFCDGYHRHGVDAGHKVAHCWSESGRQAFVHGYVLWSRQRPRLGNSPLSAA
jgi:hypothetical protein